MNHWQDHLKQIARSAIIEKRAKNDAKYEEFKEVYEHLVLSALEDFASRGIVKTILIADIIDWMDQSSLSFSREGKYVAQLLSEKGMPIHLKESGVPYTTITTEKL